ncbi:MAG: LysR family transcriptional regulator, partial [Clostridia bacterium]|nr:LysR family transcriptional regulator [Clostridia bacterium]
IKFKIINFENTPEKASEILLNLGDKIDIVPGWFDEKFWQLSECTAKKLEDEPLYCAMSINHPLAFRENISLNDLAGETVRLIKRGWNKHTDAFRDELWSNYPEINIVDVPFFNIDVFNQCEANNEILIGFNKWAAVHPLLKFVPLEQKRFVPFGILHASNPSPVVAEFLAATDKIL